MNESQLIDRVIAGDRQAARRLYDEHVDRVYRLCYRLAGDDHLAQDFTQDTFLRAFTGLGTFRREAAFGTWVCSIATSVALNGLRQAKRFRDREVDLHEELRPGPDRRPLEHDLETKLTRAVDRLPEGYRVVFIMHDLEGYTHEQIAAALGVRPGTSKSQLFRARAKLREELSEFAEEWAS
ncbi:MAG: RNA polymerase sigma factor [Gemmatimonadota bacterium]